jgi:hypothetical protein
MTKFLTGVFLFVLPIMAMAQTVTVQDDITSDATWTADNTYLLDGLIFVDSLVTLTIEPGTVIKGLLQANITTGDGASALIIRRGGKLIADGTAADPIIFTSELDDISLTDDLFETDRGLWGGLILLGQATTNQPTTQNQIEGIPPELDARYGGNNDNDDSGTLRHISIRHGGFSISGQPGDEINGLTMGAVGSQTTIEYIEVFANFDDGYEWFGGTVNTKYLVAAFCGDDAFDYDQGFRGKHQFWFTIQGQDEAGRGGEHDGGDDDETGTPYSIPLISNVTYIGSGAATEGVAGDGNDRALYFRDNAGGKYWSSVFTEYVGVAVKIEDIDGDDSRKQLEDGNLLLQNNYWWEFGDASNLLEAASGDQWAADSLAANDNMIADVDLRGISWTRGAEGLDPRPKFSSPLVSGGFQPDDDFYTFAPYYGAFSPGEDLWTDGWTALDALGFTGDLDPGTPTGVVVVDDITEDETWTADNIYLLDGLVFVDSLATLTIEPGTVIKGYLPGNVTTGEGVSALIIRRGGKIIADGGNSSTPIIFTSQLDDLGLDNDLTEADRGLWGGLILLGQATTNQPTTNNQIEGIPPELDARYGGNDDNDNSGVVRYVSIRHGGFSISGQPGDEINGLTMGAVGDGTTIEYVEVFSNFDDGYEWFGGTVNTKYLVAAFCGDDAFDYDQGFRGKHQFWFSIQGQDEAGRGGEHDGGDDDETGTPYSIPLITNVTYIGSGAATQGVAGDGNDRALYFRDNAGGKYWSSVFTEFVGVAVKIEDIDGDDSRKQLEDGNLLLQNNYWWEFGDASNLLEAASGDQWAADSLAANNNMIADPELRGISWTNGGEVLDPRPLFDSPISSGAIQPDDDFYSKVNYLGAFDPHQDLWTNSWTALDALGFTGDLDGGPNAISEEFYSAIPKKFSLNQNYPNPFNPSTTIEFALPKGEFVDLSVYNTLGQKVVTLVNGNRDAGKYSVQFDATDLASGWYIYRLQTESNVMTRKMLLIK